MKHDDILDMVDLVAKGYQIEFHSHAKAIMALDFPQAWEELKDALLDLTIPIEEIIGSGGGEAKGTQRLRRKLTDHEWNKVNFRIEKTINNISRESISHEVDHVRIFDDNKVVALEIEWNNKDPFFDRDLENFKRLHAEGAISIGIIITRGASLQDEMKGLVRRFLAKRNVMNFHDLEKYGVSPTPRQKKAIMRRVERDVNPLTFAEAFSDGFVADKFGAATTHWRKLEDRVHRGVGNPCPLILIGLPDQIVTFEDDVDAVLNEVMGPEDDQN